MNSIKRSGRLTGNLLRLLTIVSVTFFILYATLAHAQQSNLLTAGGDYFKTNAGSVSWSLGELTTESFVNNNSILTQGFQQTYFSITGLHEDLQVEIYPNPTTDQIFLTTPSAEGLSFEVFDLLGRMVVQQVIINEVTSISLTGMTSSVYLLKFRKNSSVIKIFKVIKK